MQLLREGCGSEKAALDSRTVLFDKTSVRLHVLCSSGCFTKWRAGVPTWRVTQSRRRRLRRCGRKRRRSRRQRWLEPGRRWRRWQAFRLKMGAAWHHKQKWAARKTRQRWRMTMMRTGTERETVGRKKINEEMDWWVQREGWKGQNENLPVEHGTPAQTLHIQIFVFLKCSHFSLLSHSNTSACQLRLLYQLFNWT